MAKKTDQPTGADVLRRALAEREMGQGELERALGVSKGTATHWLSATKWPDLNSAVALQKLLGIPVETWVHEKTRPSRRAPAHRRPRQKAQAA